MNTQTVKKSNEEVKVLAINCLEEWAEKFFNYEKEFFSTLVGVDPFKNDGTLKKKYEHEKQTFRGKLTDGSFLDVHYWYEHSRNELGMKVKICVNGGSYDVRPSTAFCQYEEKYLTLYKTDNGVLIDTGPTPEHVAKKYDVLELKKIAEEIKEAAKMYESVANKMPYRFREVFYIERLTR